MTGAQKTTVPDFFFVGLSRGNGSGSFETEPPSCQRYVWQNTSSVLQLAATREKQQQLQGALFSFGCQQIFSIHQQREKEL